MYYINALVAFTIGQFLFISICAYWLQKSIDNIDFPKAFTVFFHKEFGGFVVALAFTLALLFVLPDFINVNITRADLLQKDKLTKFEEAQKWFRTIMTVIGVFAQWIPFVLFKKGKKALEDYANKIGPATPAPAPNNNIIGLLVICFTMLGFSSSAQEVNPQANISFMQALKHCMTASSFWMWAYGLTALSIIGIAFAYRSNRLTDFQKLVAYVICFIVFVLAWIYIPSEVQINTTLEQAARGAYFRYPTVTP